MTRQDPLAAEGDTSQVDPARRRPKRAAHLLLFAGVAALGAAWIVTRPDGGPDAASQAISDSADLGDAVALGDALAAVEPLQTQADLAAQLKNADPASRRTAASQLASHPELGRSLVPALREALRDGDSVVSAHAAHAIWRIERDSQAITRLAIQLQSGEDEVRCLAAYILGSIGEPAASALPALRWEQRYNHGPLRLYAAEAIARIERGDRSAVETLLSGLRSNDPDQRALAAFALGNVDVGHTTRVLPMLRAALQDQDLRVRTAAEVSLSAMTVSKTSI
jgi:HEAT repeat protein